MMKAFEHAPGSAAWHQYEVGWMPVIAIVATGSMLAGNLAAIVQSNIKRLLAYSAIAHAGYAVTGIANAALGFGGHQIVVGSGNGGKSAAANTQAGRHCC